MKEADKNILRVFVTCFAAFAFTALTAFADSATVTNAWFAEPTSPLSSSWQAKLNSEPADLSTCAALVEGKVAVDVDRDAGYSLTYAPTSVVSQAQIVTAKLNFQSAYDFDALPADVTDAKAGVALVRDGSVFKIAYYDGSAWVKSDVASLSVADSEVDVRISLTGTELKYEYKSADGYITLGTVQTANKVASAEFLGSGVIAKFDGLVEQEAVVPAATVDGVPFATLEEALEYAIANKKTLTANVDCSTESGYDLKAGTTIAFDGYGATITTLVADDTAKAPVEKGETLAIAKGVLLAGGSVFEGDNTRILVGNGATLRLTEDLTLGKAKQLLAALFGAGESVTELILNTGANLDLNGHKILLENDGKVTSATKLDIDATFGNAPTGYHVEESGSGPYTYTLVEDTPEPPPTPADEDWFDGKIGTDWPTAGDMKGSWCDNAASLATFVAEKSALEIDTGNDLLKFTPENAGDLTAGIATITTTVSFTAMDLASLPDVNVPDTLVVKGGLALVRDDNGLAFYAVAKKNGEEANEWVKIDAFDALAVEETAVDVKIVMKQSNGKTLITYALGEATSAEYEIVMPNAATTINAVSYRGCGEVMNLAGIYKQGEVLLDGVPYDTFQGAYEAATNGATIKLLKDITWAPAPFAYGLKNVTVDENGKTLTVDSSAANTFKSIGYKYTYEGGEGGQIKVEMPFGGEGTDAEPWMIGTYDDLVYFRNGVNAGSYGVSGEFFKQTASIDFATVNAAEPWVGIGTKENPFSGTYDGNGKTISGLTLKGDPNAYAAFFARVIDATIKNLTVELSETPLDLEGLSDDDKKEVGAAAVVGTSISGLYMENVTADGLVPLETPHNAGGLVISVSSNTTFKSCVNKLALKGRYSKIGGICNIISGAGAGDVVSFENCTNEANLVAFGSYQKLEKEVLNTYNAGKDGLSGILAYAQGSAEIVIKNCSNKGTLTTENTLPSDQVKADTVFAQICGKAAGSVSFGTCSGNTGFANTLSVGFFHKNLTSADGLNFATVSGDRAIYVANSALLPGTLEEPKSYKVMSVITNANVTLAANEAITLDKTFNTAFTPTFDAIPGYHIEETAVSANVTTYARVQDTVTLRFAEGALEGKHIDASKTVVMQGAEVVAANPDGSYTLASNSTYTVTYTAMSGYVFPNGLPTYTTAAAQATDAEITIDAEAIDPAHAVFTITFTPNATATYTVTTNGYTFTPAGDAIVLDENAAFTVTAAPAEGFSFTTTPEGWEKSGDNLVLSATATATKTIVIPTAEEPTTAGWFDGKINANWPNATGMKGEWCANAGSLATFGDGKLAVSADSEPLAFKPTDEGKLKTDILTIQSTMKFTAMDPADLPYGAELDEDKIGLTLVEKDAGFALYAIKADGTTNTWFDLEIAGITDETEFDVTSVIKTSGGKGQVIYTINGTAYGPYPILADADSTVTEVSYKGSGEVKTLVGTTEAAGAAMIGDEIYDSFDAAYAAATDGQTIKLLKSQVWNGAFAGYKNVVIDANGKVLTIGDAVNAYAAKGLVCSYENGTLTVKIPFDGTGAEATPWQIDSYENIVLFKNGVNAGTYGTNGEFFVQTADIDFNGKPAWEGIGIYTKAGQNKGDFGFAATYDGAGHKISNLTFPNKKYAALFAQVGQTNKVGVVKNLTVENATFVDMSADGEWGGALIVGHLENGTISACCSAGTLGSEQYPLTHNVSGILGRLGAGTVENCTNSATLYATGSGTKIGGIVNICQIDTSGKAGESTIRGCVNTGTLTFVAGTANDGTGGILGYASNGNDVIIENCVNTGTVVSTLDGDAKVGQIIGYISNNAVTATGNTVNADQLALGGTTTVDGLNFIVGGEDPATLLANAVVVPGNGATNAFKVMSAISTMTNTFTQAGGITYDRSLFPNFTAEIVAAGGFEVATNTFNNLLTYTAFTATIDISAQIPAGENATVKVYEINGATTNDVTASKRILPGHDVLVVYTANEGYEFATGDTVAFKFENVTTAGAILIDAAGTKAQKKDVSFEVPVILPARAAVTNLTSGGKLMTTNGVGKYTAKYGDEIKADYSAPAGWSIVGENPQMYQIKTEPDVFQLVTATANVYSITYWMPDGTTEFTAWKGDYEPPRAFTITNDVSLPVAANVNLGETLSFSCWTNASGAQVVNTAGLTADLAVFVSMSDVTMHTITIPKSDADAYTCIVSNLSAGTAIALTVTDGNWVGQIPDNAHVELWFVATEGNILIDSQGNVRTAFFYEYPSVGRDLVQPGDFTVPTVKKVVSVTIETNEHSDYAAQFGGTGDYVAFDANPTNLIEGTAIALKASAKTGYRYAHASDGWALEDGVLSTNVTVGTIALTVKIPEPITTNAAAGAWQKLATAFTNTAEAVSCEAFDCAFGDGSIRITLQQNIIHDDGADPLVVDGTKAVIDLNGMFIDRAAVAGGADLFALKVDNGGELTVDDTTGGGRILNGLDAQGCVIVGNGRLTMNGGTVTAGGETWKGGVYVSGDGVFTMTGGAVTGPETVDARAAAVAVFGSFEMTGGAITGNTTSTNAAGVLVAKDATLKLGKDVDISGNGSANIRVVEGGLITFTDDFSTGTTKFGLAMLTEDYASAYAGRPHTFATNMTGSTNLGRFNGEAGGQVFYAGGVYGWGQNLKACTLKIEQATAMLSYVVTNDTLKAEVAGALVSGTNEYAFFSGEKAVIQYTLAADCHFEDAATENPVIRQVPEEGLTIALPAVYKDISITVAAYDHATNTVRELTTNADGSVTTNLLTISGGAYATKTGRRIVVTYHPADGYAITGNAEQTFGPLTAGGELPVAEPAVKKIVSVTVTPDEHAGYAAQFGGTGAFAEFDANPTNILEGTAFTVKAVPDEGYEYASAPAGWAFDSGVVSTNITLGTADLTLTIPSAAKIGIRFAAPVGEHVSVVVTNLTAGGAALVETDGKYSAVWGDSVLAIYTADPGYTPTEASQQEDGITDDFTGFDQVDATVNNYAITYRNADGSNFSSFLQGYPVPTEFAVTNVVTLPVAANLDVTGYLFNGWTNENGTVTTTADIFEDLTVYASLTKLWQLTVASFDTTRMTCTVYVDGVPTTGTSVPAGSKVEVVFTAKPGYTIFGDSTVTFDSVAGNISVTELPTVLATPDYLSFTAVNGDVTVKIPSEMAVCTQKEGGEWTTLAANAETNIPVGTSLYLRADLTAVGQFALSGTGQIEAAGDVMTLLDQTGLKKDVGANAFASLFKGCAKLTTAPTISATNVATSCYKEMFAGTSITNAPALPVTELAASCYEAMFAGCTTLTEAPELPATAVMTDSYKKMFTNCSNLASVRVGLTAWGSGTTDWLDGVAAQGCFYCSPELVAATTTRGASTIPTGWLVNPVTVELLNIPSENMTYVVSNKTVSGEIVKVDGTHYMVSSNAEVTLTFTAAEGYQIVGDEQMTSGPCAANAAINGSMWTVKAVKFFTVTLPETLANASYKVSTNDSEITATATADSTATFTVFTNAALKIEFAAAAGYLLRLPEGFVNPIETTVVSNLAYEASALPTSAAICAVTIPACTNRTCAISNETYGLETYVFDNCSTDNVFRVAQGDAVKLVYAPAPGFRWAAGATTNCEYMITVSGESYVFDADPAVTDVNRDACTLKLPTIEGLVYVVTNVGVEVTGVNNAYTIAYNTTADVYYQAAEGWYLMPASGTNSYSIVNEETYVVQEGDFPKPVKLYSVTLPADDATLTWTIEDLAVSTNGNTYVFTNGTVVSVTCTIAGGQPYVFTNGTGSYAIDLTIAANVSAEDLAAQFDANRRYTYSVRYTNGETFDMTTSLVQNAEYVIETNGYVRTGYAFAGWTNTVYDAKTYQPGDRVTNLTATAGATVTLVAAWKANTYTLRYEAGEGEGTAVDVSQTFDVEGRVRTADGFSFTGHGFANWTNAFGTVYNPGETIVNLATNEGDTVIFTATWTANVYKVTFETSVTNKMTLAVTNTVTGAAVEPDENGDYLVEYGTLLCVSFTAREGYLFESNTPWEFTVDGDKHVPATDANLPKTQTIAVWISTDDAAETPDWNATNAVTLIRETLARETVQKVRARFLYNWNMMSTMPDDFGFAFNANTEFTAAWNGDDAQAGSLTVKGEGIVVANALTNVDLTVCGDATFAFAELAVDALDTTTVVSNKLTLTGAFTVGAAAEATDRAATLQFAALDLQNGAVITLNGSNGVVRAKTDALEIKTIKEFKVVVSDSDAEGYYTYTAEYVGSVLFYDPVTGELRPFSESELGELFGKINDSGADFIELEFNEEVTLGGVKYPAGSWAFVSSGMWEVYPAEGKAVTVSNLNGLYYLIDGDAIVNCMIGEDEALEIEGTATISGTTVAGELWLCGEADIADAIKFAPTGLVLSKDPIEPSNFELTGEGERVVVKSFNHYFGLCVYENRIKGATGIDLTDGATITAGSLEEAETIAADCWIEPDEDVTKYLSKTLQQAEYDALFKKGVTDNGDGTFKVKVALDDDVITAIKDNDWAEAADKLLNNVGVQVSGTVNIKTKPGLYYGLAQGDTLDVGEPTEWVMGTGGTVQLKFTAETAAQFYQLKVEPIKPVAP